MLHWLDAHNPHTLGGDDYMFRASTDRFDFDIIQFGNHSFGAYVVEKSGREAFGYLNKIGLISCGPGAVAAMGLKPECSFPTIKEAQQICEFYAGINK